MCSCIDIDRLFWMGTKLTALNANMISALIRGLLKPGFGYQIVSSNTYATMEAHRNLQDFQYMGTVDATYPIL